MKKQKRQAQRMPRKMKKRFKKLMLFYDERKMEFDILKRSWKMEINFKCPYCGFEEDICYFPDLFYDIICPSKFRDKPEGCERNLGVVTLKSEQLCGSEELAQGCETRLDENDIIEMLEKYNINIITCGMCGKAIVQEKNENN